MDFRSGLRAKVTARASVRELAISHIDSVSEIGLVGEGEFNGHFALESIGRSASELAANSSGSVQAIIGRGNLRERWIDNLGGDFAKALNHWVKTEKKEDNLLNCLAVNVDIEGGRVKIDKNVIFSTPAATVVGKGGIDLASEELALRVEPMARTGTGLNAGSYINVVRIGGTLGNPKLTPNGVGALKAGTSAWLAATTGGLSLLAEGFLKRKFRRDISCDDVIPGNYFTALD